MLRGKYPNSEIRRPERRVGCYDTSWQGITSPKQLLSPHLSLHERTNGEDSVIHRDEGMERGQKSKADRLPPRPGEAWSQPEGLARRFRSVSRPPSPRHPLATRRPGRPKPHPHPGPPGTARDGVPEPAPAGPAPLSPPPLSARRRRARACLDSLLQPPSPPGPARTPRPPPSRQA